MEIYLDANATTPVLAQARAAALQAMADDFGNPSSMHSTGLKARALMAAARERVRRLLETGDGHVLFLSGATEGIQTAVLSALNALRERRATGDLLLYGATEHKAVPEAIRHWNRLLGLDLEVQKIPVGLDGRHDLAWLRQHAPRAALVCTMAANNETGVISDLAGIEAALAGSAAYWLVDGVQALGKLPLRLAQTRIDYAPFSGHKLYAPKGIGLLYVRAGAPFTPLMTGGGQEGALRSGTENMSGIAALGAVLEALEAGETFRDRATMRAYRDRLAASLSAAFSGLLFNAPQDICLPTTLNFSVPGLASRLLQDLFDAAGVRVSGGSACSAAVAEPSFVLRAMGLPAWQCESALRLSFGPLADVGFIDEACRRIAACGEALRRHGLSASGAPCEALPQTECPDAPRLQAQQWDGFMRDHPHTIVVDVREPFEQAMGSALQLAGVVVQAVPLSRLLEVSASWLAPGQASRPLVFVCRSGNRSAQAAQCLRRLGHSQAYTLAGGLALWPEQAGQQHSAAAPADPALMV